MTEKNNLVEFINGILGTSYKHVDDIPDDKLRRACLLLQIESLLKNHPEIKVFICKRIGEPATVD